MTPSSVLPAAVLAGAAALLVHAPRGRQPQARARRPRSFRGAVEGWRPVAFPSDRWIRGPALAAALVAVVLGPRPVGLLVLLAVVVAGAAHRRRATAATRRATQLSAAVVELISGLAADLAAGHAPLPALEALADEHLSPPTTPARQQLGHVLRAVAEGGRLGAVIPPGLRRGGQIRGAEGLQSLAAAWQVAELTGASLGRVLTQVVEGLRDQQVAERSVLAALSGARATARLLAALPLLGLVLGTSLGLAPAQFLLETLPGRACLVAGLGLEALGLTWTDRLAEAAVRPGPR